LHLHFVLNSIERILTNLSTSDWPLCSHAPQICLWLAIKLNAAKICCK